MDVNAQGLEGVTPMMSAVSHGALPVIRTLVAKGADLELTCSKGHTALVRALLAMQQDAGIALLEAGANWRPGNLDLLRTAADVPMLRIYRALLQRARARRQAGGGGVEGKIAAARRGIKPVACGRHSFRGAA